MISKHNSYFSSLVRLILLFALGTFLTSCSSVSTTKTSGKHKQQAVKGALTAKDLSIRFGKHYPNHKQRNKPLSYKGLQRLVARQDIIYAAEQHTRYGDHLLQLHLLQMMHRQNPKLAIGLEWFQMPFQKYLDQYIAGRISEKTLLEKTEYYSRWAYDYRMLRPVMEYARQHKLPVIALNADVDITRKVGRNGLSALTKAEASQIPSTLHPANKIYRNKLANVFKMHSRDPSKIDNFVMVQRIWDQTMANNIVRFLQKKPGYRMIVMAGVGHIESRNGIPGDVDREWDNKSLTIYTTQSKKAVDGKNPTDISIHVPARSLPKAGKLGVFINSGKGFVSIAKVDPKSHAYKVGLRPKDKILKINNKDIKSLSDLKLNLSSKKRGDNIEIKVKRAKNNREFTTKMTLQ